MRRARAKTETRVASPTAHQTAVRFSLGRKPLDLYPPRQRKEQDRRLPEPLGTKKTCRFFAKGKCTRGKSCPFLHSIGDGSCSSTSGDGKTKVKDEDEHQGTPDTDTSGCTVKSKPAGMTKTSKVKVKPSPAAAVDGKRGDSGALTVTATAANRSTPGEAAAGTARAVSGGPSVRPRILGSSYSLSLPSKASVAGGAVRSAASVGGPAGSWGRHRGENSRDGC